MITGGFPFSSLASSTSESTCHCYSIESFFLFKKDKEKRQRTQRFLMPGGVAKMFVVDDVENKELF